MVRVLVLTSEGCSPCTRVKRILEELRHELPRLDIRLVDITTPDGTRIATENNVLYPPAVFIEGSLFAKGKIDAGMMIQTIRRLDGTNN